jgi:hypothetical protein
VARAKRTVRADARRRYRAATADPEMVDAELIEPGVPAAALARGRRDRRPEPESTRGGENAERPGFTQALRLAAGPVDLRGDLREFPSLLVRSKAGVVPGVVVVVTVAALLTPGLESNQFVALAGNVILQPPPMILAFLAGMLAPRAAWLFGGLFSLLATIGYVVQYVAGTDTIVTPLGFPVTLGSPDKLALWGAGIPGLLTTGVLSGIAVGAFAGFYRRFLNMSTPQRQAARRR